MHPYPKVAMERFRKIVEAEQINQSDGTSCRRGVPITVLDFGSRDVNGSFLEYFKPPGWKYTGLDIVPGPNVDLVVKDPYRWAEIPDNSFDAVVSGSTFEHVEFFWLSMREIARIMKPGALCCLIMPSTGPTHDHPQDCWRFYRDGGIALCKWSGLKIVEVARNAPGQPHWQDNEWQDTTVVARKANVEAVRSSPSRRIERYSHGTGGVHRLVVDDRHICAECGRPSEHGHAPGCTVPSFDVNARLKHIEQTETFGGER